MANLEKPLYLLADSQLLFGSGERAFLPQCLAEHGDLSKVKAAYIGASNGDEPAFYDIFQAAMQGVGVASCRMITSGFAPEDREFLQTADVILLAGGDIALGWQVLTTTGMVEVLKERHGAGATLIGVSAGAVQLGLKGWKPDRSDNRTFFETLGMVPFLIDCHDEANDWAGLKKMTATAKIPVSGVGIPFGSGLVYHPDHSLQPLGKSLVAFEMTDPETPLSCQILYPSLEKASPSASDSEKKWQN